MKLYGDMQAWLAQPRDYGSLEVAYKRLHGKPCPPALLDAIDELGRWVPRH